MIAGYFDGSLKNLGGGRMLLWQALEHWSGTGQPPESRERFLSQLQRLFLAR